MLKLIGGIVAIAVALISFVAIAYQTLSDMRTIDREVKKREMEKSEAIRICTLYQNVFERLILPDSFLLMKNRGDNLCKYNEKIPYIEYGNKDLFM